MAFTVLHPAALIASSLWAWLQGRQNARRGPIALPPDEETAHPNGQPVGERPAREVDAEAIWG